MNNIKLYILCISADILVMLTLFIVAVHLAIILTHIYPLLQQILWLVEILLI